jgi:transcriptional regulator with XRE-family HTH domain
MKLKIIYQNYNNRGKFMFATNLRYLRKHKGLTQTDLANMLNTTKGTISNYETGVSSPSLEVLKDICIKLNISSDELLGIQIKTTSETILLNPDMASFVNSNSSLVNKLHRLDKEKLKALEILLEQN